MAFLSQKSRFSGPPAPTGMTRQAPLIGISLKVASTMVFFVMATALKIAAETVPIGELVFARNFFGLFPVLIMVAMRRELGLAFRTANPLGHLTRASVGLTAMVCGFTALSLLPLPDATAIGFASPLFVVVLAFLLLGEKVRVYRWSAVGVGFVGILVVLSPHLGDAELDSNSMIGALIGLTGAGFAALAMITVRKLCETERTSHDRYLVCGHVVRPVAAHAAVGLSAAGQAWIIPDLPTAGLLLLIGLAGGCRPDPVDAELPVRGCLHHCPVRLCQHAVGDHCRLGSVQRNAIASSGAGGADRDSRRYFRHLPRAQARAGPDKGTPGVIALAFVGGDKRAGPAVFPVIPDNHAMLCADPESRLISRLRRGITQREKSSLCSR